jgi:peptidoglycan hydrolase-like protein with peptidoglycan-binding domain
MTAAGDPAGRSGYYAGGRQDVLDAVDPPDENAGEVDSPARAEFTKLGAGLPSGAGIPAPAGVDLYENNAWFADQSVSFMILKAWEYREDAKFAARYPLVRAQGRFRGAYLFGHPSLSPDAQAASFCTVLKAAGWTAADRTWLDHEVTDGKSPSYCAKWAGECCAAIDGGLDLNPGTTGVYTYRDFIWQGNCAGLGLRPLWIAVPSVLGRVPAMNLGPWSRPALVQYQVTSIDWDFWNGTAAELAAFWGTAARPVPQPQPVPHPAPAFPYPAGDYLGLDSRDPHCHSGFYAADQPHVRAWQQRMKARGWTISVSGQFGADSDRVARAFQQEKGLAADGKVGPVTWRAAWADPVT